MCAKSLQSCLILCDPMDCSPPGSSVHGILQGSIPEWVAMPSSIFLIIPLSLMSTCIGRWIFTASATWETQGSIPGFPHCSQILFMFFYFTILYWFCHTSTCIRHGCTRVPHPEPPSHLPPHTMPLGHPSAPAPSFLYSASFLDWLFVSYMILYMF